MSLTVDDGLYKEPSDPLQATYEQICTQLLERCKGIFADKVNITPTPTDNGNGRVEHSCAFSDGRSIVLVSSKGDDTFSLSAMRITHSMRTPNPMRRILLSYVQAEADGDEGRITCLIDEVENPANSEVLNQILKVIS